MRQTNSASRTSYKFEKISHTWTIENYRWLWKHGSHTGMSTLPFIGYGLYFRIISASESLYVNLLTDSEFYSNKGTFKIELHGNRKVTKDINFTLPQQAQIKVIPWTDLFNESNGFLPEDNLILNFEIVLMLEEVYEQDNVSIDIPICKMRNDFGDLLETKEFADVTIVTGDDQKISAHKLILSARSKVFAAMFKHPMKENHENSVVIQDFSFDVIMALLRFIYTGKVPNLKELAVDLTAAAEMYEMDRLKMMCAKSMYDNLSIETVPMVLKTASLYNMEELKLGAIHFIKNNMPKVVRSLNWRRLVTTDKLLICETFVNVDLIELAPIDNTSTAE